MTKASIRVHADVPFGNVCDVEVVESSGGAEVRFAADPHGGPECLWFCFRVERADGAPAKITLTLKHVENMLGMGMLPNIRPVVRAGGGDWERLGVPEVVDVGDGRRTVSWEYAATTRGFDVAQVYPYGPDEVDTLVADCGGYWKKDVIAVSQNARPIVRLSNAYGEERSDRPGMYLMARQHSSETTGSWVLDGFLRRMAAAGDEAPMIWAVPLSNIDGVMQGDYGKDNFPYDLNRAWGVAPMRHETLVFQRDIARWRKRCKPVLGIDSHSPGGSENRGVYCFVLELPDDPETRERVRGWTDAIEKALGPEYASDVDFARVAKYASRWETPSFARYMCETLRIPAMSFETSYSMARDLVLTREVYREIGERIASGVLTHLAEGPHDDNG